MAVVVGTEQTGAAPRTNRTRRSKTGRNKAILAIGAATGGLYYSLLVAKNIHSWCGTCRRGRGRPTKCPAARKRLGEGSGCGSGRGKIIGTGRAKINARYPKTYCGILARWYATRGGTGGTHVDAQNIAGTIEVGLPWVNAAIAAIAALRLKQRRASPKGKKNKRYKLFHVR